jgi:hypothetical protein
MANYLQGKYTLKHPEKYVGDKNSVIYRSSWELKILNYLDSNPSILKFGSEELIIPYINKVDNRAHRYFPDFVIQYKTRNNEIKNAIIEIKPKAQTKPPQLPKSGKQNKRYLNEMVTYITNESKWLAARDWAAKNNWGFFIMTEDEIFGKGKLK